MRDDLKIVKGNSVKVREGEYFDKAMRRFKKKVQDSGLLQELKSRESYEKPTTVKKRKAAAAKNRWKKQLAANEMPKRLY